LANDRSIIAGQISSLPRVEEKSMEQPSNQSLATIIGIIDAEVQRIDDVCHGLTAQRAKLLHIRRMIVPPPAPEPQPDHVELVIGPRPVGCTIRSQLRRAGLQV
jgi:hypothetical protein